MSQIVKRKTQYRNWQQDQVDREAPEFVKDPHDDFVRDEHWCLLQIRANLLKFLPRSRLVCIWMHELSPLHVQGWSWISILMASAWFWLGCGKAYSLLSRIVGPDRLEGSIRDQVLASVHEIIMMTSLLLTIDVTATVCAMIASTGSSSVSVVLHWVIHVIRVCATFLIGQSAQIRFCIWGLRKAHYMLPALLLCLVLPSSCAHIVRSLLFDHRSLLMTQLVLANRLLEKWRVRIGISV